MKRLIVCCDGTWNAPEKLDPEERLPTNVLKISRAILPVDERGVNQIVEYIRGIGTGNFLDQWIGGASGKGISSNILQAYQFISNNFQRGDHIYLFGFSRGAFTARSLSGFINHFGILRKEYQDKLPKMYGLYQRTPKGQLGVVAARYKDMSDRDLEGYVMGGEGEGERRCIPIHFLGVWDTVGSLGVPVGWIRQKLNKRIAFHDTELAPNVTYAYHGLAIHEFRKDFSPTLWTAKRWRQVVEQVWFRGAHSDIGGGLSKTGLSDIAFLWLANKAMQVGLEMNMNYLPKLSMMQPLAPVNDSKTGIYTWGKPYVRPIGRTYCDNCKPISLDEFRHESVEWYWVNLHGLSGVYRPDHEIEADDRSMDAMLPMTF